MKLSIYPHLVPGLRLSGALSLLPLDIFMACSRITPQLPLSFTPHIQVTGITAPEIWHKAVMGKEVPEENEKKVHNKEFDNLYCTCDTVQETEWKGHATHTGGNT